MSLWSSIEEADNCERRTCEGCGAFFGQKKTIRRVRKERRGSIERVDLPQVD